MKRAFLTFPIVIMIIISLNGCHRSDATITPIKLNEVYNLPAGQTAWLKSEDLKLEFLAVTADSRCPQGVECIWAGEARCKMRITQNGVIQEVELIQSGSSQDNTYELSGQYRVSFELKPYPQSGSSIDPAQYYLTMTISK